MAAQDLRNQLEGLFSDLEDSTSAEQGGPVLLKGARGTIATRRWAGKQWAVFRALVENAASAIFIGDLQGNQIYSNRACCELFGYDYGSQEMDGLPLVSFWPEEDILTLADQVLPQAMTGGWSDEVRQKRRDGTLFDAHLTVFPVLDEKDQPISIAVIVRDVAECRVENSRLFEQTQAVPEAADVTRWLHARERRVELAPAQATTSHERTRPGVALLGTVGLKNRLQNRRAYAVLQQTWQRVAALLKRSRRRWMVCRAVGAGGVFLLGALVGWIVGPPVQVESPALAAQVLNSSSPHAPAVTGVPLLPTVPSPTLCPTHTPSPTVAPSPTSSLMSTSTPAPTFTPSPTPSPMPTSTPPPAALIVPLPFPTPGLTIVSTISYTLPIPTPVQPVPIAADVINIAVLGSDQRPDWSEWHTDVIHVVSIQPGRGAVSVISIPRDLYLYIPDFWMSRINFADFYGETYGYEGGGPALVRDTLLYNLGIRVDHYVRTNFDGLIGVVDTLGGVDIPVHCRLSDYWPYPDENGEYHFLTMEPGIRHMDGETALWYARSRKTSSVFSRERRQHQVLQAIWHKARDTRTLSQVPNLWRQGQDMVMTDLKLTDILELAPLVFLVQDQNVRFYNIGPDEVIPWTTPYGGGVFLPRWERIQPIVVEMMSPIPEARVNRTYMLAEVWNGTPNQDWDLLAVDRLYRAGFPAVTGEPDRRDYTETQLVVFGSQAKGTGVGHLQQVFGLSDDQVTYQPGGSSEFGFRLILGADYQTCPEP